MKTEKPINFNAEMIRAILDGRKTQTRRPMKPQPMGYDPVLNEKGEWEFTDDFNNTDPLHFHKRLYKPGDILWVREAFQPLVKESACDEYGDPISDKINYETGEGQYVNYPATDGVIEFSDIGRDGDLSFARRSAMHMPRWASRITIEVVKESLQQLGDVTGDDILAEGVYYKTDGFELKWLTPLVRMRKRFDDFRNLWNSIYEKKGLKWDDELWVRATEFKRIEQTKTKAGK